MGEHATQLARLRAAVATGVLPPDLGRWLLDLVEELEPAGERIARRNALLREAAERMSGSRWARAGRIAAEVEHLLAAPEARTWAAGSDGVRALVARALEADPSTPCSRRHLLRLLATTPSVS